MDEEKLDDKNKDKGTRERIDEASDKTQQTYGAARKGYKYGKKGVTYSKRAAKTAKAAIKGARTTAAAAETTSAAISTAVATSEIWVPILLIALIIMVVIAAFTVIFTGGVVTGTENEEPDDPIDINVCSAIEIPGLTCYIDAPSRVENGESYVYRLYGSYEMPEGGSDPSTFTLKLTIPANIIEFTSALPGNPNETKNGSTTTYEWPLSDEENYLLFNPEEGSNPPKYTFDFSITAKPRDGVEDTIATVEFIIYGESTSSAGNKERCTGGTLNTCGEKYNISKNPDGLNFGDPNCELTTGETINKQLVRDEIMRQLRAYSKTKDYCRWSCIAHFEGGYNPNSYNGNAPRPHGAWGMFQMSPWACSGSDKSYNYLRTGNVTWKEQISRALELQYTKLIPWQEGVPTNGYWSTYKHTCYKEPDWNTGTTCKSIEN